MKPFLSGGITALFLVALFAVSSALSSIANAASSGEDAPSCLTKMGDDGKPLSILVPGLSEKAMRDKGFVPEPCSEKFSTLAARENYRDAVCHMASTYREDQIAVFERKYGERPGVLCGMAEVAVSQWTLRDGN